MNVLEYAIFFFYMFVKILLGVAIAFHILQYERYVLKNRRRWRAEVVTTKLLAVAFAMSLIDIILSMMTLLENIIQIQQITSLGVITTMLVNLTWRSIFLVYLLHKIDNGCRQ